MAELPLRSPDVTVDDGEPRVVGVDSDDAGDLLGVLSSSTARAILQALHDDPAPPSAVAERVGASLQTVHYHLGNMEAAGVVEVADTVYSEKGREMKVYAPAHGPIVVFAGDDRTGDDLRSALGRLLGGVGLLALVSVLVQQVLGDGVGALLRGTADDGGQVSLEATRAADAAASTGIEPGVAFFAGGLAVLLVGFAVWYVRHYRTA